jgi:pSer/pThr/pTyr-binding forkhead associated (FHA) protein
VRARVWLSDEDVAHGVLVGRAHKCLDAGLRAILSEHISRVHVLIRREKDAVYLYDTASTQGTFVSGARVRCVELSGEGTSVRLAHVHLRLTWRALR